MQKRPFWGLTGSGPCMLMAISQHKSAGTYDAIVYIDVDDCTRHDIKVPSTVMESPASHPMAIIRPSLGQQRIPRSSRLTRAEKTLPGLQRSLPPPCSIPITILISFPWQFPSPCWRCLGDDFCVSDRMSPNLSCYTQGQTCLKESEAVALRHSLPTMSFLLCLY